MSGVIPGVSPVFEPGETYSNEGPQCPFCGEQWTADDAHYFDEMRYNEDECPECGNTFKVRVYTETTWTCEIP